MTTTRKKRKAGAARDDAIERERRTMRAALKRTHRQEREIERLTKAIRIAWMRADRALDTLAREIVDRRFKWENTASESELVEAASK